MQRIPVVMLVIVACFSSSLYGGNLKPRYPISPVDLPPAIDGKLDDACWKMLPEMGLFVNDQNHVSLPVNVRIGRDAKNLYVGAFLTEPQMSNIRDKVKIRDGGVWQDDTISVMIVPGTSGGSHYVFTVNPSGVMEDQHNDDPVTIWNTTWQAGATRLAKGWSIEMAIPFTSLGGKSPDATTEWRMNVGRYRAHAKEVSAWSSPKGGFHNASQYGEVYFPAQRVLEGIRLINLPKRVGAESEIQVTGQSARYRTRWWWYVDGNAPVLKYGGFEVKPETSGQEKQTFTEDGESCSVQAELFGFDPPNPCLYRSESIIVKSVDPLTIRMNKIAQLIKQVQTEAGPPLLADVRKTWDQRLASLKKVPDELASRQLLQELRVAQWLEKNPQKGSIVWFSTIPFSDSDYDDLPVANEIGAPVKIQAMRDEFEPGTVNLLPLTGDLRCKIEPGDLTSSSGEVLNAANIDVRVLKNWYQAGKDTSPDPDWRGWWMAELLVKNDDMVRSDHLKHRNEYLNRKDGPELKPVSIPRFFTRRFWLTVHIPKDQKPGLYRGFAYVRDGDKVLASIPVEVRVLPLTMEPSNFTWTMYYTGQHSGGKDPNQDRRYIGDLKSMAEHGFTSVTVRDQPGLTVKDGFITEIDYSAIRRALELRKRFGLTGKTAFDGYGPYMGAFDMIHRQTPEVMLNVPCHRANWIFHSRGLKQLAEEYGLKDAYVYGMDEPSYDTTGENMKREKILCEWSHEAGIKITSAITLAGAQSLSGLLDLPVLDVPSVQIGGQRRKLPVPEAWLYWHPLEDNRRDRLMAGVLLWYGGYQGACPWIYQMSDDWDDWSNPGGYGFRQENYVYPGEDGPVPTWQYEAFREGADDVKYLEMLERRVAKARTVPLSPEDEKIVAQAEQLLNVPPEIFPGTYYTVPGKVSASDVQRFRMQVADLLLKIDGLITKK